MFCLISKVGVDHFDFTCCRDLNLVSHAKPRKTRHIIIIIIIIIIIKNLKKKTLDLVSFLP